MTELVAIVNLTPDSFSGDGLNGQAEAALAYIDKCIRTGASVIDIGAESTRPGAQSLTWEEEWKRLFSVIEKLGAFTDKAQFSIDTKHSECARRALEKGFHWINDVSGGTDPEMPALVKEYKCKYVLMHSLTVPANPSITIAENMDVVEEVSQWIGQSVIKLEKEGISRSQVIIDPGIGFGKTTAQSLDLIKNVAKLRKHGTAVLVGHSRKSFLSQFTNGKVELRDSATLAVSSFLISQQVDYLRVHDIDAHVMLKRIGNLI